MYDNTAVDEMLTSLEQRLIKRIDEAGPAWISTGPEAHHEVRRETAERMLNVLRTKHEAVYASVLSEVMTGKPISIGRPRKQAAQ